MAYKALTLSLLLCVVALCSADSESDASQCEGAKTVYQLFAGGGGSDDMIYRHTKDG